MCILSCPSYNKNLDKNIIQSTDQNSKNGYNAF